MNNKMRCLLATTGLALLVSLPVVAAAPAGRYTYPSSATVYDTMTKLTWQQAASSATYAWADAKSYCAGAGATLGGSQWRLPTLKELQTVVDESRSNPAIDPSAFPATPAEGFWSSTPYVGSSSVWTVIFDYGDSNPVDQKQVARVRCVR